MADVRKRASNGHAKLDHVPNSVTKGAADGGDSLAMRIFQWSPRTFVTAFVLGVVSLLVPVWAILLAWAVVTEVTAASIDISAWLRRRSRKSEDRNGSAKLRKFTWEEVREHNTAESLWLSVHGKVYDLTDFVDHHPGGRDFLLFTAGRDVTNAFEVYHNFTDRPKQIMAKYLIGEVVSYQFPPYKPDSGFYKECCRRVREYFNRSGLDPKSPWPGLWRIAILYSIMGSAFCICYVWGSAIPWPVRICSAIVFGCCAGITLVHWYHDASHGSLSHSPHLWNFATRCTDYALGSSILSWNHQHVLGHHLHTNVIGVDPDIDQSMRRISLKQIWKKIYRYQHIFMPVLYLFLAVKSRIEDGGLMTFVFRRNGPMEINPPTTQDFLRNVAAKSFWAFYQIAMPFFILSVPLFDILSLVFVMDLALGGWLTYTSQVSHVQELSFYTKEEIEKNDNVVPEEWAIAQVKTCIDHGHDSAMDTFFTGTLNYQIVHHLFPGVSQYHYPQIAPIVKDVCSKYDVPYPYRSGYIAALWDHLKYLKRMAEEGRYIDLKFD